MIELYLQRRSSSQISNHLRSITTTEKDILIYMYWYQDAKNLTIASLNACKVESSRFPSYRHLFSHRPLLQVMVSMHIKETKGNLPATSRLLILGLSLGMMRERESGNWTRTWVWQDCNYQTRSYLELRVGWSSKIIRKTRWLTLQGSCLAFSTRWPANLLICYWKSPIYV